MGRYTTTAGVFGLEKRRQRPDEDDRVRSRQRTGLHLVGIAYGGGFWSWVRRRSCAGSGQLQTNPSRNGCPLRGLGQETLLTMRGRRAVVE